MNAIRSQARPDAFEIESTIAPVTVLRLKTANVAHIEAALRARMAEVRQRFPFAPVVIDVAGLDDESAMELPLHDLAERLRACKLVPVGAANLPASAVWNAAAAGMAVIQIAAPPPPPPVAAEPVAAAQPEPPKPALSTMTIRQPVRSGQVIYAQNADLVVLGPVNSGAQVIADGHIHVYGPLRGHALAGAQGMADACVFCMSLEAELVSIAGRYILFDEIPAEHRSARRQLSLADGHFCFHPL